MISIAFYFPLDMLIERVVGCLADQRPGRGHGPDGKEVPEEASQGWVHHHLAQVAEQRAMPGLAAAPDFSRLVVGGGHIRDGSH